MGYLPVGIPFGAQRDTYQQVSSAVITMGYLPEGIPSEVKDMQNTIVMAFRKRMKSHGYTQIEIRQKRPFQGVYLVRAVEPLSSARVSCDYTHAQMYHAFRF